MGTKNNIRREDYTLSQTTQRLRKLIESEKIYRDMQLNLHYVSNILGVSKRKTSMIIKKTYGKSFTDFINDFRLDEVLKDLKKGGYKTHTMIGLSENAGFSSKSTFYRHFKKRIGMSPSKFIAENRSDKI